MLAGRPARALKSAQEYVKSGHEDHALKILGEVATNKKCDTTTSRVASLLALSSAPCTVDGLHRQQWNSVLEDCVKLYLTLCVQLRKSRPAKDGIRSFRLVCSQVSVLCLNPRSLWCTPKVNVQSMQNCLVIFLDKAEQVAAVRFFTIYSCQYIFGLVSWPYSGCRQLLIRWLNNRSQLAKEQGYQAEPKEEETKESDDDDENKKNKEVYPFHNHRSACPPLAPHSATPTRFCSTIFV